MLTGCLLTLTFDCLKEALTQPPVFGYAVFTLPLILYSDGSHDTRGSASTEIDWSPHMWAMLLGCVSRCQEVWWWYHEDTADTGLGMATWDATSFGQAWKGRYGGFKLLVGWVNKHHAKLTFVSWSNYKMKGVESGQRTAGKREPYIEMPSSLALLRPTGHQKQITPSRSTLRHAHWGKWATNHQPSG